MTLNLALTVPHLFTFYSMFGFFVFPFFPFFGIQWDFSGIGIHIHFDFHVGFTTRHSFRSIFRKTFSSSPCDTQYLENVAKFSFHFHSWRKHHRVRAHLFKAHTAALYTFALQLNNQRAFYRFISKQYLKFKRSQYFLIGSNQVYIHSDCGNSRFVIRIFRKQKDFGLWFELFI